MRFCVVGVSGVGLKCWRLVLSLSAELGSGVGAWKLERERGRNGEGRIYRYGNVYGGMIARYISSARGMHAGHVNPAHESSSSTSESQVLCEKQSHVKPSQPGNEVFPKYVLSYASRDLQLRYNGRG